MCPPKLNVTNTKYLLARKIQAYWNMHNATLTSISANDTVSNWAWGKPLNEGIFPFWVKRLDVNTLSKK